MRVIKLGIISFVALFLLLTAISIFIPSKIRISRNLQINAPLVKVMGELSNPAQWKSWFPGMDTAKLLYDNGQLKGVILNYTQQRFLYIIDQKPNELVAEYKGIKQKKVLTSWYVHEESPKQVTVNWNMDFTLRWYPWEKFSSILFEKQYGPQLEQGLEKLKKKVESN